MWGVVGVLAGETRGQGMRWNGEQSLQTDAQMKITTAVMTRAIVTMRFEFVELISSPWDVGNKFIFILYE